MIPYLLLTLLLVSKISADITCLDSQYVPSIASCDVAIQHLSRFLLPCLYKETVNVGLRRSRPSMDTADIRLPAIFGDKSLGPPAKPRCMILFLWDGEYNQQESIAPEMLHTFATNVMEQCIAASPPKLAKGDIEPNKLIAVKFETAVLDANGDLTIPGMNGTLIPGLNGTPVSGPNGTMMPANLPPVNPTDACRRIAVEPLTGVDLDDPQPSVASS